MGISTCKKSNLSMMNRISSMLFIVAAVFLCSASVSAETFEADGMFYNVLNDNEVEVAPAPDVFYYVRDVIIPETVTHEGKTYSITAVGEKAFEDCCYLSSVKLGNNITELGKNAFVSCIELTSMKFPKSLKKIGDYVFLSCEKLADIQFSGNLEYIGRDAFSTTDYHTIPWLKNQPDGPLYVDKVFLVYKGTCPKTVSIKDGTVCIAGGAFNNQKTMVTINLPSSLKFIGPYAFDYAEDLANVNFANVENMEFVSDYAFNRTLWLKNLPSGPVYLGKVMYKYKGDTPENYTIKDGTVTIADNAFHDQPRLKSVSIPNSVKFIEGSAFESSGVKSIVLPEGLKELPGSVFEHCTALESVKLPSTLETLYSSAFTNCTSLKQIDLPANLKEIKGGRFKGCDSLAKITLEEGNRNFCIENGILFSKDKKTLIAFSSGLDGDYRVPDVVENIGEYAFAHCNLKSVTIPASVSEIGSSLFQEAESLESVTFEPGSKVKVLSESSFYSCSNLKTLILPDSLEEIHSMVFEYCYALDSISFPETLKYFEKFGNDYCKWYKDQPDGVMYAGKLAFNIKGSFADKTLTIKEGTKAINKRFGQWSNITELVLPESLEFIGMFAFSDCSNLAVIKGGENAITGVSVFNNTKWLNESSEINGVYFFGKNLIGCSTNLFPKLEEGIENISFSYTESFGSIDVKLINGLNLPGSLKYIQKNSFVGYEVANTMIVRNIVPVDITQANISLGMYNNCVLKVPEDLVDTYRNARGWSLFRNIVGDPNLVGVEAVETDDNIRVFADGSNIVIEGVEEGTPVEVFNLNGQMIYSGVESLINVADKGIYIVRVEGKAHKVAM